MLRKANAKCASALEGSSWMGFRVKPLLCSGYIAEEGGEVVDSL
jgi:hypothetical protein